MSTFTTSIAETFSYTHARKIASKVATDLLRFRRYYGRPSICRIDEYEAELIELLKFDCINHVTYGFKKSGEWITAVKYHAVSGSLFSDDLPGRLRAGADIKGAVFTSFLSYSANWRRLSASEKNDIRARLPFRRSSGEEPGVKHGYWVSDLHYSAGGRALSRSHIRQW